VRADTIGGRDGQMAEVRPDELDTLVPAVRPRVVQELARTVADERDL
jgi:hypothetical protein